MKISLRYIVAFLMLVPLSVSARQDVSLFVNGQVLPEEKQYSDNHSHSIEDDEERKNTPSIGFDPSSVRLQKRYRPLENDSLFPKQWWRRFYFGIGGGIQGLTDNIGMVSNASANAYLGYHLTPIHSLRLSGSYIKYNFNGNNKSAKSLGVGIDYLVNLSNFAWGYDPSRVFEVSTVVGIGARYSRAALPSKINPYAHIGLNADVYISKYASLFFEPYIGAQRQMSTVLNNPSREKWNLMYGFSTGLQVSLENRTDYFSEADSIYKKIFLDTSIGVVSSGRSGGILNRLGVGYQAALGLWINPMIGLRVGAHGESFYWTSRIRNKNNVPVRYSHNQVLVGGRAELMLDPLNFSKKWREAPEGHDFDLNLLLGGELGWELKNGL